jgi:hypothetical protein
MTDVEYREIPCRCPGTISGAGSFRNPCHGTSPGFPGAFRARARGGEGQRRLPVRPIRAMIRTIGVVPVESDRQGAGPLRSRHPGPERPSLGHSTGPGAAPLLGGSASQSSQSFPILELQRIRDLLGSVSTASRWPGVQETAESGLGRRQHEGESPSGRVDSPHISLNFHNNQYQ